MNTSNLRKGWFAVALMSTAVASTPAIATSYQLSAQSPAATQTQSVLGESIRHPNDVQQTYIGSQYQPLWLTNGRLNDAGKELMRSLAWVMGDGVTADRYHYHILRSKMAGSSKISDAVDVDMLLTDAYYSLMNDLFKQRFMPKPDRGHDRTIYPKQPNELHHSAETLNEAVNHYVANNDVDRLMQRSMPQHTQFIALRGAYEKMSKLNHEPWAVLPKGLKLATGSQQPAVATVRTMLYMLGDLREDNGSDRFDMQMSQALTQFQARHGLKADGQMGNDTREALNVPPAHRARQIALNLKRWLRLPKDLGNRYVMVNKPDYQLQLINNGMPELEMRVIIGKPSRRTPVLFREIKQVVFNPTWTIPPGIKRNDIIPKLRRDPGYIKRARMAVYRNGQKVNPHNVNWRNVGGGGQYRIVQSPGNHNALGRVKFVMPNNHAIYLHDTNKRKLFARDQRALSSGCVRIERPMDLAEALLRTDREWDNAMTNSTLKRGRTKTIRLNKPVPVYLTYQTAFVDNAGLLHFRKDIYKRDRGNMQMAQR